MYIQLKTYMMSQIQQGIWKPGDKIPSENELAEQFNVSRITVKNAMAAFVNQGLIYRIQGKGSFISDSAALPLTPFEPVESLESCIAFLMPRLDNLYTANLLTGIEQELADHGYHVVFKLTHDRQEVEIKRLKELTQLGMKGIIIYPVEGETFNSEILKLTLGDYPFVIVDRYLRGLDANCVSSDNFTGAYEATKHLTSLGHTTISFLSTAITGTTSIEDRLRGYEQALSDAGLSIEYRLRLILNNHLSIYEQIKQYMLDHPDVTAIVATTSTIGLFAMKSARELNLVVPRDLSIVCFDNQEKSELSEVPLTYIDQNETNMGREAAKRVLSLIQNPIQERSILTLPCQLIVRGSTVSPNLARS
ncbi:GntR family transcriptional regulator [Paenibacillus silvestris]|nr:GntR family transcriptional regulator [Paenibacillus silvestris]